MSKNGFRPSKSGAFSAGLRVQIRVIAALMMRDALRRHGHHNLGMFWVIGEPMLLTFGVMVMWTITGLTHGSEVGAIPFALTGYSFITVWRHLCARTVRVMRNNASLAYHRSISHLDNIFAMIFMEALGIFSAFLIALLPFWLLGFSPGIRDPLVLVGGYGLSVWFSASFGLVVAGVSELTELGEHIIPPMLYITIPFTGVFTMVDWLPSRYQSAMLWSPLINGIEMFRGGLFPAEYPTHWSALYLLCWCVALTAVGLPLCRYASRFVESV